MPRLQQYRSRLSNSQIAEGMNRALNNASRLSGDSQSLFEQGRIPSAVALAILSIEESGKVSILRQMAIAEDDEEYRNLWKAYRSHTKKNTLWPLGELVLKGAVKIDGFRALVEPSSDHTDQLDQLKQLCIYTDCFINAKWSSPEEVEALELAPYLVKMARILGTEKEVTSQEITLWQKHLLPVKNAPMECQKQAVAAWFHDMNLYGLSEASPENVEQFLGPLVEPTQN